MEMVSFVNSLLEPHLSKTSKQKQKVRGFYNMDFHSAEAEEDKALAMSCCILLLCGVKK